jgi:transcriptional regulator with XRE-family HTH domain
MTFGEKLRELRESKNLMQRQVGALIEVDGAFISKIENNDKPIKREHLITLSQYFKIELAELETLWLADKIQHVIENEENAESAVKLVQNRLKEKTK